MVDDDAPLPDTARDVEDLVNRLRGHVLQLGVVVPADSPALKQAQQMSAGPVPDGYVPSRVYLRCLAEATQNLIDAAQQTAGAKPASAPPAKGWLRKPSRNSARVLVFTLSLITLVIAASVPQGGVALVSTDGAALIVAIVSTMALLVALGARRSRPPSPDPVTADDQPSADELSVVSPDEDPHA